MLKQDLYDLFGGVLNVQSGLIHILLKKGGLNSWEIVFLVLPISQPSVTVIY